MGITPDNVSELFRYDHESGVLYWKVKPSRKLKAGVLAGCVNGNRRYVCYLGKHYLEHRIIWLMTHGYWPTKSIDHIDGNGLNNRVENLREVDHQTNMENFRRARKDNVCGSLGVYQIQSSGKWRAQIATDGKRTHIGCFDTREQAAQAYIETKRQVHAGCTI